MKVNEGYWREMKVNKGYWREMKVNEGYWREMKAAALKHGIRNPESGNENGITETGYGICERSSQRTI